MRIGFIGSGSVGGTLAELFAGLGHEVWLSNPRGPRTVTDLAGHIGPAAHAATTPEAAQAGELIVVSIPFGRYQDVPAEPLHGKIVVDTENYYPQRDGQWPVLDEGRTTSSELLAAHLPGARVVKAFNVIYFKNLAADGRPVGTQDRRAVPIAGDDAGAKQAVTGLIDAIGFDAVDAGDLAAGRAFEPGKRAYGARVTARELRVLL
jgi:hypothetical protein